MISCVYAITNTVTAKKYIGSTNNFARRLKEHRALLRNGGHPSLKLQHSWNVHGENSFDFDILVTCAPEWRLIYEQAILDAWQSAAGGYNISETAHCPSGMRGRKHSDSSKLAISAANRGRKPTPSPNRGRPGHSPSAETKAKISRGLKGKSNSLGVTHTEQARKNMGNGKLGNTYRLGKKHSEETKRKMSESHKARRANKTVSPSQPTPTEQPSTPRPATSGP